MASPKDGEKSHDPDRHGAETLGDAIGHQIRLGALRILGEHGSASAKEIALEIGKPASSVRDQLRILRRQGLIVEEERRPTRGTAELFYRPAPSSVWLETDDASSLSEKDQHRIALSVTKSTVSDVAAALSGGTFSGDGDWVAVSIRGLVDRQGWEEIRQVTEFAAKEVERIRSDSGARLKQQQEPGIRAACTLMSFRLPVD